MIVLNRWAYSSVRTLVRSEPTWVWLAKGIGDAINAMLEQQQEVAKLREFIQRTIRADARQSHLGTFQDEQLARLG